MSELIEHITDEHKKLSETAYYRGVVEGKMLAIKKLRYVEQSLSGKAEPEFVAGVHEALINVEGIL